MRSAFEIFLARQKVQHNTRSTTTSFLICLPLAFDNSILRAYFMKANARCKAKEDQKQKEFLLEGQMKERTEHEINSQREYLESQWKVSCGYRRPVCTTRNMQCRLTAFSSMPVLASPQLSKMVKLEEVRILQAGNGENTEAQKEVRSNFCCEINEAAFWMDLSACK